MYRLITSIWILVSFMNLSAQELGFKEIDTTTYSLYMEEDWRGLIEFSKEVNPEITDYYYFNLRLGIAHYQVHEFISAEKYLLKASNNNKTEFVKEYLFWTYLWLREKGKAKRIYSQLSEKKKEEMKDPLKPVEHLFLEGGAKSLDLDGTSSIWYGHVQLGHAFTKLGSLSHAFRTYYQTEEEQKFNQNQYYMQFTHPVKNASMHVGALFGVKSDKLRLLGDDEITEIARAKSYGLHLSWTKRIRHVGLSVDFNYLFNKVDSLYRIYPPSGFGMQRQPTVLGETHSNNSFLPSFSIWYAPAFLKERIVLGMDNYLVLDGKEANYTFKVFGDIHFSRKLWMDLSYIPIGAYTFWDKTTNRLYLDPKFEIDRYASTLNISLSAKSYLSFTYLYEKLQDVNIQNNWNVNSYYLGLTINF